MWLDTTKVEKTLSNVSKGYSCRRQFWYQQQQLTPCNDYSKGYSGKCSHCTSNLHEQWARMVFQWSFHVVLPTFIESQAFNRVDVISADGKSQETSQLDLESQSFFSQVLWVCCGWNIIYRGWHRHGPKENSVTPNMLQLFDNTINGIRNWMYYCMKPNYEIKEEYIISKALFVAYLKSGTTRDVFKEYSCTTILKFFW